MWNLVALVALAAAVNGYTVLDHAQFMIKNIDPIVYPGQYKSHMHSFFGGDAVTKDLPTSATLRNGCYSGDNPNDLSVYWIPTLYYVKNGVYTEVKPYRFSTYYNEIDKAEMTFPTNMFSVAGNAAATRQADVDYNNNGMEWWCENDPAEAGKEGGKFPTKTCSTHLQTILRFADCVNLSNFNQRAYSSSSYKTNNWCPTGMKRIPQLRFSVRYDLRKIIPGGWSGQAPLQLACGTVGNGYCFHGDFINGWTQDALDWMFNNAKDKRTFFFIPGARGTGPKTSSCKAADRDPTHGTSDYLTSVKMMSMKRDVKYSRESMAV